MGSERLKRYAERQKEVFVVTLHRFVNALGTKVVAKRTGISAAHIQQYTSGRKSAPTLIMMMRIAMGLGVRLSDLVGDDLSNTAELFPDHGEDIELAHMLLQADREELELLLAWLDIPDGRAKQSLILLIDELAGPIKGG